MIKYNLTTQGKAVNITQCSIDYVAQGIEIVAENAKVPIEPSAEYLALCSQAYRDNKVAIQYKEDRAGDYYHVANQLDMQYHDSIDGTTTWEDHITAVKTKWPKDNSGPVE